MRAAPRLLLPAVRARATPAGATHRAPGPSRTQPGTTRAQPGAPGTTRAQPGTLRAQPRAPGNLRAQPGAPGPLRAQPTAPETPRAQPTAPGTLRAQPKAHENSRAQPTAPETPRAQPETPRAQPTAPKTHRAQPGAPGTLQAKPKAHENSRAQPTAPETPRAQPETPRAQPTAPKTPRAQLTAPKTPRAHPGAPGTLRAQTRAPRTPRAQPTAHENPRVQPRAPETPRAQPRAHKYPRAQPMAPVTPRAHLRSPGTTRTHHRPPSPSRAPPSEGLRAASLAHIWTPVSETPLTQDPRVSALSSAPVSTFPGSPVSRGTRAPVAAAPGALVSTVPWALESKVLAAPVSAVSWAPVSRVLGAPVSAVSWAPVSSVLGALVSAVSWAPVSRVPRTPVSAVSWTPVSSVLGALVSAVSWAPVSRAHRAPVSAVSWAPVCGVLGAPVSAVPWAPVSGVLRPPASVGSDHPQSSGLSPSSPLCSGGSRFLPLPRIRPASSSSSSWKAPPVMGMFSCAFSTSQVLLPMIEARSQYHSLNSDVHAPSADRYGMAACASGLLRRIIGQFDRASTVGSSRCRGVRFYYRSTRGSDGSQNQFHVVDLRSDTLTTPNAEMRNAMAQADVGDDVYGEDPTVNELQRQAAQLFGTEEALFVASGTMGNLISVMCHCRNRGEELLVGDKAHLHLYEQGGVAQIAGVSPRLVRNLPDGRLDLQELEGNIQHGYPDPHYPHTRLICVENTHNRSGGRVLPPSYLREVRLLADRYGLSVHLDGARVMNAAVALGVAPAQIVQHCESVSMCLSKGLGAPVGAVIGGRREFIMECLRLRKVLGGGMRQAGVLAAPGLVALAQAEDTLKNDHHNAKKFADGVQELASPLCSVDLSSVETNIVMMRVDEPRISPQEFCDRMWEVSEAEVVEMGQGVKVRMFVMFARTVRAVWYRDISLEDTELALEKLKFVVQKYREELRIV